jgi:hypothetical protein
VALVPKENGKSQYFSTSGIDRVKKEFGLKLVKPLI